LLPSTRINKTETTIKFSDVLKIMAVGRTQVHATQFVVVK
jgi:hypothetical protein